MVLPAPARFSKSLKTSSADFVSRLPGLAHQRRADRIVGHCAGAMATHCVARRIGHWERRWAKSAMPPARAGARRARGARGGGSGCRNPWRAGCSRRRSGWARAGKNWKITPTERLSPDSDLLFVERMHRDVVDDHFARSRAVDAGDDVDQRRFTTARFTDNGDEGRHASTIRSIPLSRDGERARRALVGLHHVAANRPGARLALPVCSFAGLLLSRRWFTSLIIVFSSP